MVRVTFTYGRTRPNPAKPTIAEALASKLGRDPTDRELCREVARILGHSDAHGAPGENDPIGE